MGGYIAAFWIGVVVGAFGLLAIAVVFSGGE